MLHRHFQIGVPVILRLEINRKAGFVTAMSDVWQAGDIGKILAADRVRAANDVEHGGLLLRQSGSGS
jgi:hypothetical protein